MCAFGPACYSIHHVGDYVVHRNRDHDKPHEDSDYTTSPAY
jgi:hypothetical protein